jgi:hypothetical protein
MGNFTRHISCGSEPLGTKSLFIMTMRIILHNDFQSKGLWRPSFSVPVSYAFPSKDTFIALPAYEGSRSCFFARRMTDFWQ